MNNTFSMARFQGLFRKHTAEQYKYYLMSVAVLAGILAIFIAFHVLMDRKPLEADVQFDIFVVSLYLCCALFTCSIFSDLGNPRKAIAALTLPASHAEKFFVKWLYSVVVFPLVFAGIFYVVMTPIQNMAQQAGQKMALLNILREPDMLNIMICYMLVHSVCLLGSIFFKKLHFIKTGFVMMIIIMGFVTANTIAMQAVLGVHDVNAFPFSYAGFVENGTYHVIYARGGSELFYITVMVLSVIFWVAAFFRLKEKQV